MVEMGVRDTTVSCEFSIEVYMFYMKICPICNYPDTNQCQNIYTNSWSFYRDTLFMLYALVSLMFPYISLLYGRYNLNFVISWHFLYFKTISKMFLVFIS